MRYVLMLMACIAALIGVLLVGWGPPPLRFFAAVALQLGVAMLALGLAARDFFSQYLSDQD
jgi:peptidoglycan/LPS O-acetylase OafA/YrhL